MCWNTRPGATRPDRNVCRPLHYSQSLRPLKRPDRIGRACTSRQARHRAMNAYPDRMVKTPGRASPPFEVGSRIPETPSTRSKTGRGGHRRRNGPGRFVSLPVSRPGAVALSDNSTAPPPTRGADPFFKLRGRSCRVPPVRRRTRAPRPRLPLTGSPTNPWHPSADCDAPQFEEPIDPAPTRRVLPKAA